MNFVDATFGRLGNRLFQSAYIYAQFRDGKVPDIYLQDLNYFDKYRDELQQLWKQDGEPLDYISIHVRRGKNPSVPSEPSYSENSFYAHLGLDYYQKAIEQFPNQLFHIFTDDPGWCMQQDVFYNNPCAIITNTTDLEDFSAMSRCKGHIIANSSFSWWAAYLGGGKTVAPQKWFANNTRINYPKDWIVI